jgi:outer membrane protein OmpA-like peptidoglycan-associated protein
MRLKHALLASSILAAPLAVPTLAHAQAQPVTGLYVGAGAGANFLSNETVKSITFPNGAKAGYGTNPKFDTGFVGLASIGYGLGNGVRVELEGNYRENSGRLAAGFGTIERGDSRKYGAMVNALYDFNLASFGITGVPVTPYLGVGAGYAREDVDGMYIAAPNGNAVHIRDGNGSDMFAYQAIAGVAYSLDSVVPGLALTAEYRFYATPQAAKYGVAFTGPGINTLARVKVADDLNNSVMLGVRYAFNAAPPPPPPAPVVAAAPAPAPTRTYLVFFDWDRSDLTARARQIVADAAQNASRVQYTRIEVNGNADRSGTPQYNMGLSLRRAQTVAAELVRDGVRRDVIDIHAYGDTRPLVPTAAGVREPQNRRVEIIIR